MTWRRDGNGDVNLDDFTASIACLGGPDTGLGAGCVCFDFDSDGEGDLLDIAESQVSYTGN